MRRSSRMSSSSASSIEVGTPISSAPATPIRTSTRTKKRPSSQSSSSSESGIYVVDSIIARSIEQVFGDNGVEEYQYLVRWEGYGPKEDTWEMESNLVLGAADIVRRFQSQIHDAGHPFTLLDWRDYSPKRYQVRYGESPYAQTVWQTAVQMRDTMGVTNSALAKAYHKGAYAPRSYKAQQRRLLAILDHSQYRKSKDSKRSEVKRSGLTVYMTRWREGRVTEEGWIFRSQLVSWFGPSGAMTAIQQYHERLADTKKKIAESLNAVQLSQYEEGRLRNIQENQDLMRQLGF
ncbi:hypothetical protein BCR39DRAFT_521844 [Naematelia encephala]|uniref:Chromo domain-containing protein n=1 Tax=Naematelia encephala TaxID=71784 RepID=A0A1Y2BDD4_9TREE|nr:hypothetical protein BCR39DRAFT_521844 [Naematelia encephala]